MPVVATAGGLPTRLGKYEILTPLAAGGMARIYVGRSTGIGSFERHVVLKMILPERANDEVAVQMFLDEARLAASLNHQNVAQVFEVGQDAGIHFLAMEYVHGQDLRALLAKAGSQGTRVPLELALTVVAGAAAGLNHAHDRRSPDGTPLGIVHRDVSPSNIMIGYDGAVKLLDFGIAKATSRSVETQSGIIKGKFAYMSPEQCRGREVDRRSDVFSLGIILYEISTQHRCFRADSDFDTMHRIVTGDVVRPTRLLLGYPQALEAIVMKALAVDANQRYQSAGLLLEAIESFAISARMSLSTMSLGRFMRDMFGEVPEPWLVSQSGRGSQPLPPQAKEQTISNTNGTGSEVRPPGGQQPLASDSAAHLARTVLELPPDSRHDDSIDPAQQADWNAKSYPNMPPTGYTTGPTEAIRPSAAPLPGMPVPHAPPPQILGAGTQPMPPPAAFNQHRSDGSQSGRALPFPSTRQGYTGAPGPGAMTGSDISYPRYDAPSGDVDLQLKPNRRPLVIGLGITVVGVAILLAMWIGGGGKDTEPTVPPSRPVAAPGSDTTNAPSQQQVEPPGSAATQAAPADAADEEEQSISLHVVSTPPGADVLLAGKPIGTTPLDTKIKRGTGFAVLTVHRAGFQDVSTNIDLSGDLSKEVQLQPTTKPTIDDTPTPPEQHTTTPPKTHDNPKDKPKDTPKDNPKDKGNNKAVKDHDTGSHQTQKSHATSNPGSNTTTHKATPPPPPPEPEKPKCQDPAKYNPFDTTCSGKPCPPCS